LLNALLLPANSDSALTMVKSAASVMLLVPCNTALLLTVVPACGHRNPASAPGQFGIDVVGKKSPLEPLSR